MYGIPEEGTRLNASRKKLNIKCTLPTWNTLVMWGWENFSSKPKAGNRLISALFSNNIYVGSCPILPVRVRLPYQLY